MKMEIVKSFSGRRKSRSSTYFQDYKTEKYLYSWQKASSLIAQNNK